MFRIAVGVLSTTLYGVYLGVHTILPELAFGMQHYLWGILSGLITVWGAEKNIKVGSWL